MYLIYTQKIYIFLNFNNLKNTTRGIPECKFQPNQLKDIFWLILKISIRGVNDTLESDSMQSTVGMTTRSHTPRCHSLNGVFEKFCLLDSLV